MHVPVAFQLSSGMYSYLPTHCWEYFGAAGSLGMSMHRTTASTSLCPFSTSFSSHLSTTQASAPNSSMVCAAFAGALPLPTSDPSLKSGRHWQITVPLLALVLVLGAGAAWLTRERWMPAPEAAREEHLVSAPNVPAIAVLPFTNLSGDTKQDYFSDGLTEDILTELSRARDLRVLARNTTFQYKGQAVDAGKLGHKLKVSYLLEGSVRCQRGNLRVTAQLIDTETGAHVWADHYDRELADVFVVQDEIVNQIVGKIAGGYGAIERNEAKAAARKSPNEIQAYDLVLRARDAMQWDWIARPSARRDPC